MRKLIATSIVLSLLAFPSSALAEEESNARIITLQQRREERAKLELYKQMLDPSTAPLAYWEALARCETNSDWANTGKFAGGLGIMTAGTFHSKQRGTWERWGGEDYAASPDRATKVQQIVVANRIAKFGFRTWKYLDPKVARQKGVPAKFWYDKYGRGYFGWGCAAHIVGNPCGQKEDGTQGTYKPSKKWAKKNCKKH
jgi:hypothetical protein